MTNVVRIDFRAEASTFDDAWLLVPVTMRRRSKKMAALREAWDRHARDFGQQKLLGSLRAYVRDKDFDRHGGQALDRWLANGRYEHFASEATRPAAPQFSDPMVRRAVVGQLGEDFAVLYLDPCETAGKALIARTQVARDRLLKHRLLFKSLGFSGVKKATQTQLSQAKSGEQA